MQLKFLTFILLYTFSNVGQAEWTPPQNPDLHKILEQASQDKEDKSYQSALEKHIWFHENALQYDNSFYGVRLSFALSDWFELSQVYEPALKELLKLSDENLNKVKAEKTILTKRRESFHDFVSINETLNRNKEVVDLFKWLDINSPTMAKRCFDIAKPSLIRSGNFTLCGKYIEPEKDFLLAKRMYLCDLKIAKKVSLDQEHQEYAENSFINTISILVATLAINKRHEEAEEIIKLSTKIMDTKIFRAELNKALSGTMPDTWP